MTQLHRTFISFHHEDEEWKTYFEQQFSDRYHAFISTSVSDGDIDPNLRTDPVRQRIREQYLRNSTVTVVLVGRHTWQRKHVDWEISASIRQTRYSSRSGLLGVLLPTYPGSSRNTYDPHTMPPRLYENIECTYAKLHNWTEEPTLVRRWIDEAFLRRDSINPDNSFPMFARNRTGGSWQS